MVEILLKRGDRVAGTTRKSTGLEKLKDKYDDRLWLAHLDLTDEPSIRRVVDEAFAFCGRIDVMVNNAEYGLFGAAEEVTDDQIRHQNNTNLIGSIQVIRAAIPHLRSQGGGRILQVSSTGGQDAFPNFSLYHAPKWGTEGFVESVQQEVAPFHIDSPSSNRVRQARTSVRVWSVRLPCPCTPTRPSGEVRRAIENSQFPYRVMRVR